MQTITKKKYLMYTIYKKQNMLLLYFFNITSFFIYIFFYFGFIYFLTTMYTNKVNAFDDDDDLNMFNTFK